MKDISKKHLQKKLKNSIRTCIKMKKNDDYYGKIAGSSIITYAYISDIITSSTHKRYMMY